MNQVKKIYELCLFIAFFAAGAYLRINHLSTSPEWYSDEGAFIEVAKNLLDGKWQYFAIQGSPLLVGRPPLFFYILSVAFRMFGVHLVILRGLTVALGLLTCILLYLISRKIFGVKIALLAAGIMAIFPSAVEFNRVGFTYNLLLPLLLINFYGIWKFWRDRSILWGSVACITAGLAISSDYIGMAVVFLTMGMLLLSDWRWWIVGPVLITMPIILILSPIAFVDPIGLAQDLTYTFFRVSLPLPLQLANIPIFFGHLLLREAWVLLGMIGIFLIPDRCARLIILFLYTMVIFLLVRMTNPPAHHLIPLLPFACLGVAFFLKVAYSFVSKKLDSDFDLLSKHFLHRSRGLAFQRLVPFFTNLINKLALSVLFISPILWMVSFTLADVYAKGMLFYSQEILLDGFASGEDIKVVIQELEPRIQAGDIVIASPHVGWAIPGNVIDFQQATAYSGGVAFALPKLDRSRFAFDSSLQNVTYAVVDDLWRIWGVRAMPETLAILEEVETWPVIFTLGEFQIHKNPN